MTEQSPELKGPDSTQGVELSAIPDGGMLLGHARGDAVLPPVVHASVAVEAGSTQVWYRYVGDAGDVIGVDRFGASAPGKVVMHGYGFTVDNVCACAKTLLN